MKKNSNVTMLVLAFVLLIGGTNLLAQKGQGPHDMKGPAGPEGMRGGPDEDMPRLMMMERDLIKQIGLTEEQQNKIDALQTEHQKSTIGKQSEMKIMTVDLKTEMDKDTLDMAKINELADKMSKIQAELGKERILHVAQVANVMTKEQRAKLEQLRIERRHQMAQKFNQDRNNKPMKKGR